MIKEYFRPGTVEAALELLGKGGIRVLPIGGGTAIYRFSAEDVAILDLQDLPLSGIQGRGNQIDIGATTRLQDLLESPQMSPEMQHAVSLERSYNLRQVATLAGTIVAADGRSSLVTVLLSLDTVLIVLGPDSQSGKQVRLGDILPVRDEALKGKLVTQISIPENVRLAFNYSSRTPADLPIVCCSVAVWPSGRTRVAVGGFGTAPILAFDGPDSSGAETAAREACSQAGDEWASADYRQDVAGLLVKRCLTKVNS